MIGIMGKMQGNIIGIFIVSVVLLTFWEYIVGVFLEKVFTNLKKLSYNIKTFREEAHLTQEKLAEKANISLDFLGKIEVCINKPGLKSIIKISNALNIPIYKFPFKSIISDNNSTFIGFCN